MAIFHAEYANDFSLDVSLYIHISISALKDFKVSFPISLFLSNCLSQRYGGVLLFPKKKEKRNPQNQDK